MWKPIYQPDSWPVFLKREDNIGLPLMEVRQKYLKEQLEFDNFISQQNSILRGRANKTELVSYDYNAIEGPGDIVARYSDFVSNTCTNPPIVADIFDFGPDNIDGLSYDTPVDAVKEGFEYKVTLNLTSTHYPITQLKIKVRNWGWNYSNVFVSPAQGVPYVTLLSEFEGRSNVLKITRPATFGGEQFSIELEYITDTSLPQNHRSQYWNTHNWSYGIGFWPIGEFGETTGPTTKNWLYNGGGTADLLLGLSQYPDDGTSPWIGNIPYYNANEWVDTRVYRKNIIQGNAPSPSFWQNLCEITHNVPAENLGNPIGLTPAITSYETDLYLSDWVWRICPN